MKSLQYSKLSNDDLLHRYFMAQDSNYFVRQEIPRIHKEMKKRGII